MSSDLRTEDRLICEFEKNSTEVVRVRLTTYKGIPLVDVRSFYPDRQSGDMLPGKGIAVKRSLLPSLIEGLQAAQQADTEEGH